MAIETNDLVVGDTYQVNHRRKGIFTVQLTKVGRDWLEGTLVEGDPRYMRDHNAVVQGAPMILRNDLIDNITKV